MGRCFYEPPKMVGYRSHPWMGGGAVFLRPDPSNIGKECDLMKYACELCGYIYDEDAGLPVRGISGGTAFEQLGADFECPGCGCEKEAFDPLQPRQLLQTHSHSRKVLRK